VRQCLGATNYALAQIAAAARRPLARFAVGRRRRPLVLLVDDPFVLELVPFLCRVGVLVAKGAQIDRVRSGGRLRGRLRFLSSPETPSQVIPEIHARESTPRRYETTSRQRTGP
jgi:hypothetical protein